ncbi:MAG: hypothetical protein O2816_13260, partial [Planctomycetota bacterium]|nr:hypothetical protein [Planctomycetota bacterium]
PPTQPITLAALLGGAYLASDLALFERRRAPWLEALGFGLLVGLAWGLEAPSRLEAEVRPGLRALVEVATVLAVCAGIAIVTTLLANERRRRLAAAGVALIGLTTFVLVALDV